MHRTRGEEKPSQLLNESTTSGRLFKFRAPRFEPNAHGPLLRALVSFLLIDATRRSKKELCVAIRQEGLNCWALLIQVKVIRDPVRLYTEHATAPLTDNGIRGFEILRAYRLAEGTRRSDL